MLEYNGERYVPGIPDPKMEVEHWHRYVFAGNFISGKRVLDVACGEGYGTFFLSKICSSILGVDVDSRAVLHAKNKYIASNLEYLSFAAEAFKAETPFDVVVSFETIEHLSESCQNDFLNNVVNNNLTRDGVFIISTPIIDQYNSKHDESNVFHLKEFGRDEFLTFLKNYFSSVQVVYQFSGVGSVLASSESNLENGSFVNSYENLGEFPPEYIMAICTNGGRVLKLKDSILFSNRLSNKDEVRVYWGGSEQFCQNNSFVKWIDSGSESANLAFKLPQQFGGFLRINIPGPCSIEFGSVELDSRTYLSQEISKELVHKTNAVKHHQGVFQFLCTSSTIVFKVPHETVNVNINYKKKVIKPEDALDDLLKEYFLLRGKHNLLVSSVNEFKDKIRDLGV